MVYYIHGDHLGSTSLTTDSDGNVVNEVRYLPYGEERWNDGASPTDFGFTSQRKEAGFGLYDYNARYYSPALGRFVSPDTIVPEPGSSQGWNRYAYVNNNPLRFTDPSGYFQCEGAVGCEEPPTPPPPGEDPAWDRATSYDPDLSYRAFLDGRAQYERYITNPELYSGDWADSSKLASYRTDIASIYAEYGLGECLGCQIDGRLEGGLAQEMYSQGEPIDILGAGGLGEVGGGVAAAIIKWKGVGKRGNPLKIPRGNNKATVINNRNYSGHALNRMQENGITPTSVDAAIQTGISAPGNFENTTSYYDPENNIRVIVDSRNGTVITTGYGKP